MSSKSDTEVIIDGKVYTLSGYEGEEYLQRVAAYINNKINEFGRMEAVRRFPMDMKATLIEINIADDLFKAKERISEQSKVEANEKTVRELEAKNKELQQQNAKLEADIEDLLLEDGSHGEPEKAGQATEIKE